MKQTLGLIGAGAFGTLAATHLAPHFDVVVFDRDRSRASALAAEIDARVGSLADTAGCQLVLMAVPVQQLPDVLVAIGSFLRPGALVMDVGSVKLKPAAAMLDLLPDHVAAVGTHPLFGPQSARDGIKGLKIAVCDLRGGRGGEVVQFCSEMLGLDVLEVTPDEHDRELAIVSLDLPRFRLSTKTYELIDQAVDFIRYDSDELFRAIERENPYTASAKREFFAAARALEEKLNRQ